MPKTYEPMTEVRKNFRVDWYRSPIDSDTLRRLTRRSDLKGWLQSLGWLAIVGMTGTVTYLLFINRAWVGFALALFVHGTIYCFNPGLVTHELSHGTVFRTKWLNGFFLRLFSLLGLVNFHHYKRSHTYHHIYTLHPRGDREVVLPGNPSLNPIRLLWLFTINIPGLWQVVFKNVFLLAIFGRLEEKGEWSKAIFPEGDRYSRRVAINWARLILLFHSALLAVSVLTGLWLLPILVTISNFVANWWRFLIGITMHTGLRDNVPDFRKCCRTIKLDPFSRFIYWYMNYHAEHHMFAAVPCYNLQSLSRAIAFDMPKPRTLITAWREMLDTYNRQQTDPEYQYDTPVPDNTENARTDRELAAGIGDLAPDSIK